MIIILLLSGVGPQNPFRDSMLCSPFITEKWWSVEHLLHKETVGSTEKCLFIVKELCELRASSWIHQEAGFIQLLIRKSTLHCM